MKIIKHGVNYTPDNIILKCVECECIFLIETLNNLEQLIVQDPNNPQRSFTAVPCPECYSPVELKPVL